MKAESVFVAVEGVPFSADLLYEYEVPADLAALISPGSVVLCPFGAANRRARAVVLYKGEKRGSRLKKILDLVDVSCRLDDHAVRMAEFVKNKFFCTYFDAVKTVMTPGLFGASDRAFSLKETFEDETVRRYFEAHANKVERRKLMKELGIDAYHRILQAVRNGTAEEHMLFAGGVRSETVTEVSYVAESAYEEEIKAKSGAQAEKHLAVLRFLAAEAPCTVQEAVQKTGVSAGVFKTLQKHGAVQLTKKTVERNPLSDKQAKADPTPLSLSEEQQKAFDEISARLGSGGMHLLYGVTGSGKTHVYMALVDRVLAEGKTAILLVPEISITLQTVDLFCRRYGREVAVLHSNLSAGERYDAWRRIEQGTCRVVIGPRSAVFAPVKNLGILILDEEQEHTYQSEMTPKYHAVEVAAFRAKLEKALLLTASATPSFERFRMATEGKIGFSQLPSRFNTKPLPKTVVVDMAKETAEGNRTLISRELAQEIEQNLRAGEQTILFMNRRGYSSFVSCPRCKFVYTCKNCGIPLTYHRAGGQLVCHYCGHREIPSDLCPQCHEKTIKYSGAGTQKVEEELKMLFPSVRILRMDADTVGAKDSRDEILQTFRNGEADILLGTQMITKGLDFPNVTLVGVLMADMLLYSSDFRAFEKTFSVITQVVGRAGRAEKEGRAVIQTYSPTHSVLQFAFAQDYQGFYKQESALRKVLLYPPYCDICQVVVTADTLARAFEAAEAFIEDVSKAVASEEYASLPVNIIRPRETAVPMENTRHSVRLLVKCKDVAQTRKMLGEIYSKFLRNKEMKDVTLDLTMNPSVIV